MKKTFLTIILLSSVFFAFAQAPQGAVRPQRTPEEIAHKQTEMLTRELNITDSLTHDTLYRVHLRYVKLRLVSNTRAQELERMQSFYAELRQILTPEQYDSFMNMQVTPGPRQPHHQPLPQQRQRSAAISDISPLQLEALPANRL